MVLLFLRDWRSALIVVINIPLSLIGAVLALWITKQTVNIMTLGGLALAIGILVDMSTVVIENIHTHLGRGKRVALSVVDSGQGVVRVRWVVLAIYLAIAGLVVVFLGQRLGTEIFPRVDAGQLQVRLRGPTGTHVDGTEAIALQALDIIKNEAGPTNVEITLGFVGVHASSYPINLIYLWNGGSEEGVVQVELKRGTPIRIEELKERLRKKFAEQLPDVSFSFEQSEIVSRG